MIEMHNIFIYSCYYLFLALNSTRFCILITQHKNTNIDSNFARLMNKKTKVAALADNPLASSACSAVLNYLGLSTESADDTRKFR